MALSSVDKESPVLVFISTPGSSRGEKLKSRLKAQSGFRVHILDAVMVNDFSQLEDLEIDTTRMSKTLLRPVLPNEIGCSISHNLARQIIADDCFGGVILEDDAEIDSIDALLAVTVAFLELQKNTCSVLSLTTTVHGNHATKFLDKKTRFYRLLGTPALAQSYVVTPAAAEVLKSANTPIRYLADWPTSEARFFTLNRKIVMQPLEVPISTIDPSGNQRGRNVELLRKKLSMYFGFYYVMNSQYFDSFNAYLREMILHRVFHHIDKMLIRVYSFRECYK